MGSSRKEVFWSATEKSRDTKAKQTRRRHLVVNMVEVPTRHLGLGTIVEKTFINRVEVKDF